MNTNQTPKELFQSIVERHSKLPTSDFINNPLPSTFNFTKSRSTPTTNTIMNKTFVDRPFGHIFVSNGDETPLLIDVRNAYYDPEEQLYIIPMDAVEGDVTQLSLSSGPSIQPDSDNSDIGDAIDIPLSFYPSPDGTAKRCRVCITAPIDNTIMQLGGSVSSVWEWRWFSDETAPC